MSISEDNIRIFQQLIITQPQLFSEHEAELQHLAANLPDDIEKLSDAISDWCAAENRPQILETLQKLHNDLDQNRELGNTPRSSEKSEAEIRQNLFELLSIRNQQKQTPVNPPKS